MIIEKYIRTYIVVDDINPKKCSNNCRFFDADGYFSALGGGWCVLFMETDDYTLELIINMYRCQQCLDEFGKEGTDEAG